MQCEYFFSGACDLASSLAGVKCETTEDACKACAESSPSKAENAVTYSLAYSTLHKKRLLDPKVHEHVYSGVRHFCTERHTSPIDNELVLSGVGTRLAGMLPFLKKGLSECSVCRLRVRLMNRWGTKKCKEKKELILRWLKDSAERNGYPFSPTAVTFLINAAIALEEAFGK